jgi:hypothetical protein
MAVFPAALHECTTILDIFASGVDLALFSVLGYTIALEVPQMSIDGFGADELPSPGRASLRIELHDASLDRDPT